MRFGLIDVFGSGLWTAKVKDTAVISDRPRNQNRFKGQVRGQVRSGQDKGLIEIKICEAVFDKIVFSINSINNFNDRLW